MKIDKTYELPFPLRSVYEAWISPETVIPPATRLEIRAEQGGHYRLFIESPDFSSRNEGTFDLVEPFARLVYSWEWDNDGEVTTIDVRFGETGAGTRIDLTHGGFTNQESVANHDAGWDGYVAGFANLLAARP